MGFNKLIRYLFRPLAALSPQEPSAPFELQIMTVARTVAASGDHRITLPTEGARSKKKPKEIKIGFFGNIANNAYNYVKCHRRLGYDAELVVEDGFFDTFLLNRPFWEDVEVECTSYEEGLKHEYKWSQPHYVRRVSYDVEMQARFQGRYSAIPEIQGMYKEAFDMELPQDRAFLLAQHMGHWPYLLAMKRYDVIQFSGAPISMGVFCPKPFIIYPTGGDLFITPFEETIFGLMVRASYRKASHIIYAGTNYRDYLERLSIAAPKTFAPSVIDTDTYAPGESNTVRRSWEARTGGKRFLFSICRQNWYWKGNDILLKGFARFIEKTGDRDWRLVLQTWGPDVDKTKELIGSLGIAEWVLWENLCSKPTLRKRQQAADLVADQFVMEGYGTSVLESMSAAKAVMIHFDKSETAGFFKDPPPFLEAFDEEGIASALSETGEIKKTGELSREWIVDNHGFKKNATANYLPYLMAIGLGNFTYRISGKGGRP